MSIKNSALKGLMIRDTIENIIKLTIFINYVVVIATKCKP